MSKYVQLTLATIPGNFLGYSVIDWKPCDKPENVDFLENAAVCLLSTEEFDTFNSFPPLDPYQPITDDLPEVLFLDNIGENLGGYPEEITADGVYARLSDEGYARLQTLTEGIFLLDTCQELFEANGSVRFQVTDDGIAISREVQPSEES